MYEPKMPITSAMEVKAILGPDFPSQVGKVIDHVDTHCRAWIERCPFIVISSIDAAGNMDTSPKGDRPGFVKVLDRESRSTSLAAASLSPGSRPWPGRGDGSTRPCSAP